MKNNKSVDRSSVDLTAMTKDLVDLFANVIQVEEYELRNGPFSDLTVKEVHTIYAISMYEEKSASQVARAVRLSPSAMSTAIDRLVKKGYVERRRSKADRRVVKLGLTHAGRVLFRAHQYFHYQLSKTILADLSDEQAAAMAMSIHQLQQRLQTLKAEL
ncbi:MarR family transcriptional regulator [Leuconostocaceae bacterium ESL0958]|nr:MarR family transcriptional regulator [Leuconostocaceae bacterium ESL0958]